MFTKIRRKSTLKQENNKWITIMVKHIFDCKYIYLFLY